MIEAEGADEMELIDTASDEAKQVAVRTTGAGARSIPRRSQAHGKRCGCPCVGRACVA